MSYFKNLQYAAILTFSSPTSLDRQQLKAALLFSVESSESLLDEIGSQALATGTYTSPATVVEKIDSVATADIVNVSHVDYVTPLSATVKWHSLLAFRKQEGSSRAAILQY